MSLKFHPRVGQILMCDFTTGFKTPEMIKIRPIVVIATGAACGAELVTVAPLSTARPDRKHAHNCVIDSKYLPNTKLFKDRESWLKADMVSRVGFHRLSPIYIRKDSAGKRIYFNQRLGRDTMRTVYECTLHGLNLGDLAQYL